MRRPRWRRSRRAASDSSGRDVISLAGPAPTLAAHAAKAALSRSDPTGAAPTRATRTAAQGVAQHRDAVAERHRDAGVERLRSRRGEIDVGLGPRIGGVELLEAAVEAETVDEIRADAAADPVVGLEQHDWVAGVGDHPGGGQAGEPGTDDHDIGLVRGRHHGPTLPSVPVF